MNKFCLRARSKQSEEIADDLCVVSFLYEFRMPKVTAIVFRAIQD